MMWGTVGCSDSKRNCWFCYCAEREGKLPSPNFLCREGLTRQHPFQLTVTTLAVVGSPVCPENRGREIF
jgi:hypothetical protein